jgi:hypothetical protein
MIAVALTLDLPLVFDTAQETFLSLSDRIVKCQLRDRLCLPSPGISTQLRQTDDHDHLYTLSYTTIDCPSSARNSELHFEIAYKSLKLEIHPPEVSAENHGTCLSNHRHQNVVTTPCKVDT